MRAFYCLKCKRLLLLADLIEAEIQCPKSNCKYKNVIIYYKDKDILHQYIDGE